MKSLIQLTIILLLLQPRSFAQLNVFGPVAETLQTSTYNTFGVPTANYWWCAHGVDVLIDGYLRTRQDSYKTRMKNLLLGIKSFNGNTYINHFYDDMEWLGIASLRAYQSTGDADYLNVANLLWTDIGNGYTNGAIDWNKNCAGCKNTCSNTPAVIMGVKLYRITNVAADLQRAKDIYAFVKARLVDVATGAVWDNYSIASGAVNKAVFSYNVGTYIGAGLELYKITGDVTYLNDAVKSAEYAMNYRTVNGLLFADETGGGDGGLFKGIFLRYFALLAREGNIPAATRARYNEAIRLNAETLRTQGINTANNLVSPRWNVPPGSTTDYSTQLSGVMLVEAAATLDQSFFYKDINYGGVSWGLPAGSYNTAALVAKGIKDNDITSFTIPAGYQVTFFKNDNFSGGSTTVTANSQWIGNDWNDSISSLIVNPIGVATVYKDCNYGGAVTGLQPGAYSLAQLRAKGIADDDISSLKVQSGYKVTLYWDDNFQGSSLVKTADDGCLVDDGWNDKATSLIISNAAVVSTPVLIQAEKKIADEVLVLYPNPVKDVLTLKAAFDLADVKIQITDVLGRVVLTTRTNTGKVDVSRLPAGIYALVLIHNGQQWVKRFVK